MRILMLGNSFTAANHMPRILAGLTGGEVTAHTRGGARLAEHLNPATGLGERTQAALRDERWDYVVLQEMSHGPVTAPGRFFSSVERLCCQIRCGGAVPVLFATWPYRRDSARLAARGWDYDGMARALSDACHRAARENHALIADVGGRFYELADVQELYAADGIHPNERGSRVAAEVLAAVIRRHEEEQL